MSKKVSPRKKSAKKWKKKRLELKKTTERSIP
jgi:hypothetical protein